jgi:hypothetical protein
MVQTAEIEAAGRLLRGGELVAFPTETVYGLGAHALDSSAVARVFEAKGRPHFDPLIVHVAEADAAWALADLEQLPEAVHRVEETGGRLGQVPGGREDLAGGEAHAPAALPAEAQHADRPAAHRRGVEPFKPIDQPQRRPRGVVPIEHPR